MKRKFMINRWACFAYLLLSAVVPLWNAIDLVKNAADAGLMLPNDGIFLVIINCIVAIGHIAIAIWTIFSKNTKHLAAKLLFSVVVAVITEIYTFRFFYIATQSIELSMLRICSFVMRNILPIVTAVFLFFDNKCEIAKYVLFIVNSSLSVIQIIIDLSFKILDFSIKNCISYSLSVYILILGICSLKKIELNQKQEKKA